MSLPAISTVFPIYKILYTISIGVKSEDLAEPFEFQGSNKFYAQKVTSITV